MRALRTLGRGLLEAAALLLLISALQACSACATTGAVGVKQTAYVGAKDVATLLETVQSAEIGLVCGRPSAPPAGACVPLDLHHTIQGYILEAAEYDRQAAAIARSVPEGAPTPLSVMELVSKIYALVDRILAALPKSPAVDALAAKVGR